MPINVEPIITTTPPPGTTLRTSGWSVLVAPTGRPVTWDEAKAHLRLDTDDQQAYVESLIDAATDYAEERLSASLMSRTLLATFYNNDRLELPRGPVIAVQGIIDADTHAVTD